MELKVSQKGDFRNLTGYLEKTKEVFKFGILNKYGRKGVEALSAATPIDTGETANSWYYDIVHEKGRVTLQFCNSHIVNGVPIAIILQYGHATRSGGWVEGRDYINPAILPIFDQIVDEAWREIKRL